MIIEKEFKSFKLTREVIETKKYINERFIEAQSEEEVEKLINKEEDYSRDIYIERGSVPNELLSRKVTIKIEEVK